MPDISTEGCFKLSCTQILDMKIVYFGSDVFLSCFEYFLKEHEVLALYTYHNDEDYFHEYSIAAEAREHNIPVHYEAINEGELRRLFNEEGCELLFSAEYDRIIRIPEDLQRFRGINIHSSLLPAGRGYYPIEAAYERGLDCLGVTMHKLTPKLDQGDILAQHEVKLSSDMDSIDVYLENAAYMREILPDVIDNIDVYWAEARQQTEIMPCWRRPDDTLLTIRHDMSRREALNVYRSYNSMTQLETDGVWYYAVSMTAGAAPIDREVLWLSDKLLLYRVSDGHLRIVIQAQKTVSD